MSVTAPLHTPVALRHAAAMTQQPDPESRIARRIRLQSPRRQCRDLPAGPRRAGLRRYGCPQQQGRGPRALRRQRKPPARGQVEAARLAPGFDQHSPERRTAGRLATRAQHALGITRPHQQDAPRIEPEFGQARRMQTAGLGIDDILPHPENRACARRPDRQPDGEARRRHEVGRTGRIDLVQRRPRDAAAQNPVESGRAEAHLPALGGIAARRHGAQRRLREMAAQIGQGIRVRSCPHEGSCSLFVLL